MEILSARTILPSNAALHNQLEIAMRCIHVAPRWNLQAGDPGV